MKPRVFVGSSSETLAIAYAVQQSLEHSFEVTVWTQDVFKLSSYPVDSLLNQLRKTDFGIFILGADDVLSIRGKKYSATRDNVIYELGMFTGRLGRHCVFAFVPKGTGELRLPGDLAGLIYAEYDTRRSDNNLSAAVGPACNLVRKAAHDFIGKNLNELDGVERAGLFTDFDTMFDELLRDSSRIVAAFIHSRRWREEYDVPIRHLLTKKHAKFQIFLPDLQNRELIETFKRRFDDGPHIPGFVADAYRYFYELKKTFGIKVQIRVYKNFLSYSFYRFDNTFIIAVYPNDTVRKPVPTWRISSNGSIGEFLKRDIEDLEKECSEPSLQQMKDTIAQYCSVVAPPR